MTKAFMYVVHFTILCHVILGFGFPLASHSRVMVEPFLTTNFPSEG